MGDEGRKVRRQPGVAACGDDSEWQVPEQYRGLGRMRWVRPGEARDRDAGHACVLVVDVGVRRVGGAEDGVYATVEVHAGGMGAVSASGGLRRRRCSVLQVPEVLGSDEWRLYMH